MPLKSADTLDLLTDVKSAAVDRWHPEMHLKMNGGILSLLYQQVKLFLLLSSFRIWWTQYSFFLISCFMKLENHKIIVICSTTLFHFFYSEFWQHVWRFFFFFFLSDDQLKKKLCVWRPVTGGILFFLMLFVCFPAVVRKCGTTATTSELAGNMLKMSRYPNLVANSTPPIMRNNIHMGRYALSRLWLVLKECKQAWAFFLSLYPDDWVVAARPFSSSADGALYCRSGYARLALEWKRPLAAKCSTVFTV